MADQQFTYNADEPMIGDASSAKDLHDGVSNIPQPKNAQTIEWQASEFIEHGKNASWFMILIAGATVVAAAIYLITHNILAVIVVVLSAVAMGQLARSKPATNSYSLTQHGLTVNGKFHPISDFRAFSMFQDGAIKALHFDSAKRFGTPMTVYYSPDDQDKIVSMLEQVIPQDTYKPDTVDRMMRRVRF